MSRTPDRHQDDCDNDCPPEPTTATALDSALRLIAPPLAAAARLVASAAHTHPVVHHAIPPVEDLDLDLSWGPSLDLDDVLFPATQYLQLDPGPPSLPAELLRPAKPDDRPMDLDADSATERATERATGHATEPTAEHATEHAEEHNADNSTGQAIAAATTDAIDYTTDHIADPPPAKPPPHPATPPRRHRLPAQPTPKRARPRPQLPPSQSNHTPIAIAPRAGSSATRSHPGLRSVAENALPPASPQGRSPASTVSREAAKLQLPCASQPPQSFARGSHFPVGMHHPMIPLINMGASMYPLQHHHMFQPPSSAPPASAMTPAQQPAQPMRDGASRSVAQQPAAVSAPGHSDFKKMRMADLPASAASSTAVGGTLPHPHYLPSPVPLVPPGMFSYDPSVVPLLMQQQMYLAAAAGAMFPQGVMPTVNHSNHPSISPALFQQFAQMPNMAPPSAYPTESLQMAARQAVDSVASNPQPPGVTAGSASMETYVGSAGMSAESLPGDLPQQALARLERHPMFGKVHSQNVGKEKTVASFTRHPNNLKMMDTQNLPVEGFPKEPAFASGSRPPLASMSKGGVASQGGASSRADADHGSRPQKKRLVWTPELHERFVKAIDVVGLSQAVPKALVTIMNVEGLTTEHVKSHLQKYRNSLRKEAAEDARAQSDGAGMSLGNATQAAGSTATASGTLRVGLSDGVITNESGMQQYRILPNRISLSGTPVTSSAIAGSDGGTTVDPLPGAVNQTEGSGAANSDSVVGASSQNPSRPPPMGAGGKKGGETSDATGNVQLAEPLDESTRRFAATDSADIGILEKATNVRTDGTTAVRRVTTETPIFVADSDLGSEAMMELERRVTGSSQESKVVAMGVQGADGRGVEMSMEEEKVGIEQREFECGQLEGAENKDGMEGRSDAVAEVQREEGNSSIPERVSGGGGGSEQKEAELAVIEEQTLQMQLMLQMMVHRTIALKKKIEQETSERMRTEGSSGGVATSGRSARDAGEGNVEAGAGRGEDGDSGKADDKVGEREEGEKGKNGQAAERGAEGGVEVGGDEKVSKPKSELAALLQDQEKLGKALEEQRAMLSEKRGAKGRGGRGGGGSQDDGDGV